MLEHVHLYKFAHSDLYKKIKPDFQIENNLMDAPLALFLVPTSQPRGNKSRQKWRFADKLPAQRIKIDPSKLGDWTLPKFPPSRRVQLLLQATRGVLCFLPSYDPVWFDKPDDYAYFLGYYQNNFASYYSRSLLIHDYLLEGKIPESYMAGLEDATFKF